MADLHRNWTNDWPATGDELTPTTMRLTAQRLLIVAAANRDFAPIHTDREAARETGAEDAYANMMWVMATMEKTLLGTFGDRARLVALRNLRMTAFNRAGDTVTCRGAVTSREGDVVEVDIWLESSPERRTTSAQAVVKLQAGRTAEN